MQVLGSKAEGARLERMKASSRFKDGTFQNTHPVGPGLKKGTGISTIKEFVCGGQRRVPTGVLPVVNPLEPWLRPVHWSVAPWRPGRGKGPVGSGRRRWPAGLMGAMTSEGERARSVATPHARAEKTWESR